MKAICKYPGAKWGLAGWITSLMPPHHSYLEPFFGSGAVLFNKQRSPIETVNDLDGNVVNLFKWIRDDPERLAHEIYWTPYSRQAYEGAYSTHPGDSLQQAVQFYTRLNQGHGYRTNGEKVGWKNDVQGREKAYAAVGWCNLPDKILQAAERLRGVQIECRPAVEVIRRFNSPKVLVYADPPYVLSTRHGKQYRCEMDDGGHVELAEALAAHPGPVILSGYDNGIYNGILRGWHKLTAPARAQTGGARVEVLWLNYEPLGQMEFV